MAHGGKRAGAGRKPSAKPAATVAAAAPEVVTKVAEEGITLERTLRELGRIGYADIRKVVQWASRETGVEFDEATDTMKVRVSNEVTLTDSGQLPPEVAAAISEISQTKDGALKIKMHPKIPALAKLLEHLVNAQPDKPAEASAPAPALQNKDDPWAGLLPN